MKAPRKNYSKSCSLDHTHSCFCHAWLRVCSQSSTSISSSSSSSVGQAGLRCVIIYFTWGYLSLALLCFHKYPHCAAQSSFRVLIVHQVESEILQSHFSVCQALKKENGCRYISQYEENYSSVWVSVADETAPSVSADKTQELWEQQEFGIWCHA